MKAPTQGEIEEVVYCEGLKILRRWFDSISLHKREVLLLLGSRPRRKVEELGCGVIGNTRLFGGRIPESYSGIPTKNAVMRLDNDIVYMLTLVGVV